MQRKIFKIFARQMSKYIITILFYQYLNAKLFTTCWNIIKNIAISQGGN